MKRISFAIAIAAAILVSAVLVYSPVYASGEKSPILQKLEDKMGKPLTNAQTDKILLGVKEMTLSLKSSQDKLLKEMTSVTGLSRDQILTLIPRAPQSPNDKNFLEKLETAMGRSLKDPEKEKVGRSFYEFIISAKNASDKFITRLSEATGLPEATVREIISGQGN
jgi:hypothetical protein